MVCLYFSGCEPGVFLKIIYIYFLKRVTAQYKITSLKTSPGFRTQLRGRNLYSTWEFSGLPDSHTNTLLRHKGKSHCRPCPGGTCDGFLQHVNVPPFPRNCPSMRPAPLARDLVLKCYRLFEDYCAIALNWKSQVSYSRFTK